MRQPLTTETRSTIDSATLIDQVFYNRFSDNPDCDILDAGVSDHGATSVRLSFFCKKCDDTGTTYKVFSFIQNENARQDYLGILPNELKKPNLHDDFGEQFEMFLESIQNSIEL